MSAGTVAILMQKELRDAVRSRWFILYSAGFTGLALALVAFALTGAGNYGLAGFGRTGASLINLILLIVPMMGITLGGQAIAGESERGTLPYLLAQPVDLLELLVGKYAGLAASLFGVLIAGFGISGVLIATQQTSASAWSYLGLVGLSGLLALCSLSAGFLLSSVVRSGATALGSSLFLWLALVFFGDLGLMSTALVLKFDVGQMFAASLINPLQVFKMAAILVMGSNAEVLGPVGVYAFRTYGTHLLPLLLVILLAWSIIPLVATYWIVRRKGII